MADHSLWKVSSPDLGIVNLDFSFPSGAAEDASFPTGLDDGDGYLNDGYGMGIHASSETAVTSRGIRGAGVFGVLREGVGLYKIILRERWKACISQTASLTLAISSNVHAQFRHPMLESETGSDGVVRSVVRLRIVGVLGVDTDLLYNDRVNVRLCMKNSSEQS